MPAISYGVRTFRRRSMMILTMAALSAAAAQASTLRIVNYNIDDDTGGTSMTDARVNYADLGIILQAIGNEHLAGNVQPIDVLALQELHYNNPSLSSSLTSIVNTLNGIYGAGTYTYDSLVGTTNGNLSGNGPNGLIYNTHTVEDLGSVGLTKQADGTTTLVSGTGAPRQPIRYLLRPMGYGPSANFYVYDSHYKASSGSEGRRKIEADAIRADSDALGSSAHIIYTGDFNLTGAGSQSNRTEKGSAEPAYLDLTAAGNAQANDPLNATGWDNTSAFTHIETESGDDITARFDFQLVSNAMLNQTGMQLVPNTYTVFGNSSTTAFGGSVASPNNTAALTDLTNRSQVLSLLGDETDVTDHLPIVADYTTVGVSLQDRYYLGPTGGTWTTDTNWNTAHNGTGLTGKPLPNEIAHVIGSVAKTVTFNADFSSNPINTVYVDGTGAEVTLVQSSATAIMNVSNALIVGDAGIGHYVQSAGAATIAGAGLVIGNQNGSTGIYELNGGTLTAGVIQVGSSAGGAGTFSQTAAGTLNVTGSFTNRGTTTLAGAQHWAAGSMFTNAAGTASFQTDAGSAASSTLSVVGTGGTITFASPQHLAALNLSSTGNATIAPAASAVSPTIVTLAALSIDHTDGSMLDLTNNEVLTAGPASSIRSLISNEAIITTSAGLAVGYSAIGGTSQVEIRATLPGDTNLDGNVDVADLGNLATNFGLTSGGSWTQGDFDYNGSVNVADLGDLATNFGATVPGGGAAGSASTAAASAVPEPTALALLTLAATTMLPRRRRPT